MPTISVAKQLSQRLIPSTSNAVLYTAPDANTTTYIKNILVTNTTNAAKSYSIYVNQSGNTASDQNALWKNINLPANSTYRYNFPGENDGIILVGASASVIVNVSVANTVTFSLYGIEVRNT